MVLLKVSFAFKAHSIYKLNCEQCAQYCHLLTKVTDILVALMPLVLLTNRMFAVVEMSYLICWTLVFRFSDFLYFGWA